MSLKGNAARVAATLVILFSLPIAYLSVKWGMADMYAYPVRYDIERWEQKGVSDNSEIAEAAESIDRALSWQPQNPELIELKARVQLYEASLIEDDQAFKEKLRSILSLHEQAIGLRSEWAYSWANKALIKAYLQEFDAEYLQAMQQAVLLGPWELSANLAVLEAGLIGWFSLSSDDRIVVTETASRTAEHQWKMVKNLLDRYQRRYAVCSGMQRTEVQNKVCY